MKRIVLSLLIINLLFICNYSVASTISGDDYVIELPATYQELSEGNYTSSNGNSVMVTEYPNDGNVAKVYSKNFINIFEDYLNTKYTKMLKEELNKQLSEIDNNAITGTEIDELVKSLDFKVEKREITNVTKNKYKCVHYLISASFEGASSSNLDTYLIATTDKTNASNNRIFILMCAGPDVDSSEMKEIRNSFTISNYQKPTTIDYLTNRYGFSLFYYIGALLIPIIGFIIYRKRRKKK